MIPNTFFFIHLIYYVAKLRLFYLYSVRKAEKTAWEGINLYFFNVPWWLHRNKLHHSPESVFVLSQGEHTFEYTRAYVWVCANITLQAPFPFFRYAPASESHFLGMKSRFSRHEKWVFMPGKSKGSAGKRKITKRDVNEKDEQLLFARLFIFGRDYWTRTSDLAPPRRVRYQLR